ncbi:MAG: hypothetical protein N2327_04340 [Caldimicrobium sp.]|nr:hypothetical protein [Caldimicrobium sp.]MCX7873644.1 hypothetical protein [Caldimicrobium sp.]MDW8094335.1 hypothetical protein [Caldimicrobium sp.]
MKETLPTRKIHQIKVKKPLYFSHREKLSCPYCGNSEEFYEIIENANFYIHYIQTSEGTLEPIEEEAELMGPIKFFCASCHSDLSFLKK